MSNRFLKTRKDAWRWRGRTSFHRQHAQRRWNGHNSVHGIGLYFLIKPLGIATAALSQTGCCYWRPTHNVRTENNPCSLHWW